jgi:hypothetical protein
MSSLVNMVIGLWRGADGKVAEVVYEQRGELTGPSSRESVHALKPPRAHFQTAIEHDDNSRVLLPVDEIAHILPDKTGVLVIFDRNRQPPEGLTYCPPPNNAAIFNADGSLRFQLQNPFGVWGSFRAALHNRRADGVIELGVRVCPSDYPACETVYVVDGSTPDLSKQLPRWVRD